MLKRAAYIFGIVLVVAGILGFVPGITTEAGYLLGIFQVDPAHNIFHILTGAAGIYVGSRGEHSARRYFQVVGVIYLVLVLLGFVYGNQPLFGMMAHNIADVVLHIVIAAVTLYLGFGVRERATAHA